MSKVDTTPRSKFAASSTVLAAAGNMPTVETIDFGFDANGIQHLMSVLTNLYSRPEEAVLREVTANGLDAHKAIGVDAPVEVILPNELSPTLRIIDEGVGMSREDLRTVYTQYGASSKRDDFNQIGAFGLGGKSPLAIASSFTVSSVKDGMKTVALIKSSNDGVTADIISHEATTEGSGTEVSIYVSNVNAILEAARKIFATWEPGSILIDGRSPMSFYDDEVEGYQAAVDYEGYRVMFPEPSFRNAVRSDTALMLNIGGIGYRVDLDQVTDVPHLNDDRLGKLIEDNVVSFRRFTRADYSIYNSFPIMVLDSTPHGVVDLVPSRDDLRYTTRTTRYIRNTIAELIENMNSIFQTLEENGHGAYEAAALYYEAFGDTGKHYVSKTGEEIAPKVDTKNAVSYTPQHRNGTIAFMREERGYRLSNYFSVLTRNPNSVHIIRTDVDAPSGSYASEDFEKYLKNRVKTPASFGVMLREHLLEQNDSAFSKNNLSVIVTTKDKDLAWLPNADNAVTHELDDLIKSYKSILAERRKAARENGETKTTTTAGGGITYSAFCNGKIKSLTIEEIAEYKKVMFLAAKAGESSDSLRGHAYGGKDFFNSLNKAVPGYVDVENTVVIYVPRNRKVSALVNRLKRNNIVGTPMKDMFYQFMKDYLKDKSEDKLLALALADGRHNYRVSVLAAEGTSDETNISINSMSNIVKFLKAINDCYEIKNKNVQKMFKVFALVDIFKTVLPWMDAQTREFVNELTEDIALLRENKFITDTLPAIVDTYPLVAYFGAQYYIRNYPLTAVVDYVKMIDNQA